LETGLLASIVVVIVAQLTPQIVSSVFPVQFLDIAIMRPVYYACIMLEFTGIAHACWVLVHLLSLCFGMNSKKEVGYLDGKHGTTGANNQGFDGVEVEMRPENVPQRK
jgi:hypothetical protein